MAHFFSPFSLSLSLSLPPLPPCRFLPTTVRSAVPAPHQAHPQTMTKVEVTRALVAPPLPTPPTTNLSSLLPPPPPLSPLPPSPLTITTATSLTPPHTITSYDTGHGRHQVLRRKMKMRKRRRMLEQLLLQVVKVVAL